MLGAWLLYWVSLAAQFIVCGYAVARGPEPQRLTAVYVTGAMTAQQIVIVILRHLHLDETTHWMQLDIDRWTDGLMCFGLLTLAFRYEREPWLVGLVLLSATELCLDSLVFQDDVERMRNLFPDVSNLLSLAVTATLAAAVVWRRKPQALDPSPLTGANPAPYPTAARTASIT